MAESSTGCGFQSLHPTLSEEHFFIFFFVLTQKRNKKSQGYRKKAKN
jgi:hypothetical protein